MDLATVNKLALLESKEAVKLHQLPKDEEIKILSAKIVSTKYGNCPLIELEENIVFLPKRVLKFVEMNIEDFNNSRYNIIFRGLKNCNKINEGAIFEFTKN